jgi:hypothetical protein
VIHVGDDGDVANTWVQLETLLRLQIGAYYYSTMLEGFRRRMKAETAYLRWMRSWGAFRMAGLSVD